jgi:hypothetical protein
VNAREYVELREGRGGRAQRLDDGSRMVSCPAHEDRTPSLHVSEGRDGRLLLHCHAGCELDAVLGADGLAFGDLFVDGSGRRVEVEVYRYTDEHGAPLFEVGRFDPKAFLQRRPGRSDWKGGIRGVRRVLYRLPKVLAAVKAGQTVYVVEGERDVHALERAGSVATCNPMGAGKWRREYAEALRGADVVVVADRDEAGRTHAEAVAGTLRGVAASVVTVEAAVGKDASDHLAAGRTVEQFARAHDRRDAVSDPVRNGELVDPDTAPCSLDDVVATFQRWLHLPDPDGLLVVLGAVAANLLDGDPVWLGVIAAPSSGKSELLTPTTGLSYVHAAATLTEAALLSGTPKKERAAGARGGLLRQLGEFGILVCKDFGSVLSMDRSERARVLGALREVYDGSWTRRVGTDGGRELHWEGKAGLLAAATPILDRHHAVMAAMGERLLLYRLTAPDRVEQARFSLKRARDGNARCELREAVAGLFATDLPTPRELSDEERERLIELACLAAAARSTVERDAYSREIELIPDSEAPARLALQLAQLLAGLDVIGVERNQAWGIVRKAALDSIPALRRLAIEKLRGTGQLNTTEIAKLIGYPTQTARRALEELAGHGVLLRESGGAGKADRWQLAEWATGNLSRNVGKGA